MTTTQSSKSIFLRSIDNPSLSTQYTAHTAQTTVARFSPSGYYVASGDASGSVRVWDCVGEGATKGEYFIISGRINDIAWDGDSQRIIAVGDGRQRFGACITADSGNSVGEISGHSAQVNAVSIRQQRPLRAATAGDDKNLVFYHGAPFKFNTSARGNHSNFIYGTAFSPDGANLVTVGGDRKIWLYDGKTGETKAEIGEGVHKGSIFGVSWAKDSKRVVTASADRTVKIWDVEAGKAVQSWSLGEEGSVSVPDQQVGVVWPAGRSDGLVISLSLSGDLNYLAEGKDKPIKVVQGHEKNITSLCLDSKAETLWTGSYEGRLCSWDLNTGTAERVEGDGHTNYVAGLAATTEGHGRIYSIGWDDSMRSIDVSAKTFTGSATKLSGQPKGIATAGSAALVARSEGGVAIYDANGNETATIPLKATPTSIAGSSKTKLAAIGCEDSSLHIFNVSTPAEPSPQAVAKLSSGSAITALSFSPDGSSVAAGDSSGKICVFKATDGEVVTNRWSSHTARITSFAWNATGTHAVSGSLDTNIFVWSLAKPGSRVKAANAHKEGVNGVAWLGDGKRVVSTGADAAVKIWGVDALE